GNIAGMLDSQDETDTPLKRKLGAVGITLTIIGVIVCVLIFAIGAVYHRPLIPQFLVAISLAISIIPEGLPATATIVMALGVQRMAK
ncbi:P-type ATPase, partial [Eubacterium callanderi]|uniref:P-type ATPase n=1 Tax=Eubacterium callanderi TaxID=53442 RepID=UPI003F73E4A5